MRKGEQLLWRLCGLMAALLSAGCMAVLLILFAVGAYRLIMGG